MKKIVLALAAAVLLLRGTMNVCAYDDTQGSVRCYCSIDGKEVKACTAVVGSTSATVVIHSHAYNESGDAIGSGGNAGGGCTCTTYTASETVSYAVQEHEVPSYNVKKILIQYAN